MIGRVSHNVSTKHFAECRIQQLQTLVNAIMDHVGAPPHAWYLLVFLAELNDLDVLATMHTLRQKLEKRFI